MGIITKVDPSGSQTTSVALLAGVFVMSNAVGHENSVPGFGGASVMIGLIGNGVKNALRNGRTC